MTGAFLTGFFFVVILSRRGVGGIDLIEEERRHTLIDHVSRSTGCGKK